MSRKMFTTEGYVVVRKIEKDKKSGFVVCGDDYFGVGELAAEPANGSLDEDFMAMSVVFENNKARPLGLDFGPDLFVVSAEHVVCFVEECDESPEDGSEEEDE